MDKEDSAAGAGDADTAAANTHSKAGSESRAKKRAAAAGETQDGGKMPANSATSASSRSTRVSASNGGRGGGESGGGRSPSKATKELSNGGSRRERKQKFDVRKLLNIRQAGNNSVPVSSPASSSSKQTGGGAAGGRRLSSDSTAAAAAEEDGANNKKRRSGRVKAAAAAAAAAAATSPAVVVNGTSVQANDKEAATSSEAVKEEKVPEKPVTGKGSVERVELMTGKRERKRKKFWDEEQVETPVKPERDKISPPPAKSARRVSEDKKATDKKEAAPKASKGSTSKAEEGSSSGSKRSDRKLSGDSQAKSSKSSTDKKSVVTPNPRIGPLDMPSGKQPSKLPYMQFDMSLEPELIAKVMVEGVNIPGPAQPIPVDSSMLPDGWEKRAVQRNVGVTKGKWDIFILSPTFKSFRSKMDLQRYLDDNKTGLHSENFDFSLDNQLKRLRQIWKQYIVIPRRNSAAAEAQAAAASSSAPSSVPTSAPNSVPASPAATPTDSSSRRLANDFMSEDLVLDPLESPASLVTEFAVRSETGQGLRCTIENCGKLFRNDRLVSMHVKHYHRQFYNALMQRQKNVSDELHPESTETSPTSSATAQAKPEASSEAADNPPPPSTATAPSSTVTARKRRKKDSTSGGGGGGGEKRSRLHSSSKTPSSDTTTAAEEVGGRLSLIKRGPGKASRRSEGGDDDDDEDDVTLSLGARGGGAGGARRSRNDSILSVGSESSTAAAAAPNNMGDDAHPHSSSSSAGQAQPSAAPSTPPTFRISKRRQHQQARQAQMLNKKKNLSPVLQVTKVEETVDGRCYMEEYVSFLNNGGGAEGEGASASGGGDRGAAGGSASYPPSEMDASIVSEHLTSEEVVNCTCSRTEEDGLMIQCDICLCWQHGNCLGFEGDDQVPDKHVCKICRDPPKGRPSALHSLDQDWLKEGKLPTLSLPPSSSSSSSALNSKDESAQQRELAFKKLSEMMADLANLSKVLHSLRVKLQVASQKNQKNSSKVFMWSAPWEKEQQQPPPPQQQQLSSDLLPEKPAVPNGPEEVRSEEATPGLDLPRTAPAAQPNEAPSKEHQAPPLTSKDDNGAAEVAQQSNDNNHVQEEEKDSPPKDPLAHPSPPPKKLAQNGPSSILFPRLPDDEDAIVEEEGETTTSVKQPQKSEEAAAGGKKTENGNADACNEKEEKSGDGGDGNTTNPEAQTNGHSEDSSGAASREGGDAQEREEPDQGVQEQPAKTSAEPPSSEQDENNFSDLDPSMIPSLSEVEQLLPSIIQASMEGNLQTQQPAPPQQQPQPQQGAAPAPADHPRAEAHRQGRVPLEPAESHLQHAERSGRRLQPDGEGTGEAGAGVRSDLPPRRHAGLRDDGGQAVEQDQGHHRHAPAGPAHVQEAATACLS